MYSKGVTTREIAELREKMYGHYYSRQTISNITQTVQEQVAAFHSGLEQVLLFVTDGLTGIREELLKTFPKAKHQTC